MAARDNAPPSVSRVVRRSSEPVRKNAPIVIKRRMKESEEEHEHHHTCSDVDLESIDGKESHLKTDHAGISPSNL
jgi:hypothetical protein